MGAEDVPRSNGFNNFMNGIANAIDGPITWFRGKLPRGIANHPLVILIKPQLTALHNIHTHTH